MPDAARHSQATARFAMLAASGGPAGRSGVDEWLIGVITFACVFSGALLGMYLRSALPKTHLSDESKDAVKLGMGLVATMSALVLGLLVATAKGSYDDQRRGL